jgi:hypothetical protein
VSGPCLCGDPECGRCFPQPSTWPPTWKGPQWKEKRGTTTKARAKRTRRLARSERSEKADVRIRDRHCRFPHCGCRQLFGMKAIPTVSHLVHKGAGGDPKGLRSKANAMIFLCKWRHQDARISRDRNTLRYVPLTDAGTDGPVAWEMKTQALLDLNGEVWGVDVGMTRDMPEWTEIARESAVNELLPLEGWQATIIGVLAEMEV